MARPHAQPAAVVAVADGVLHEVADQPFEEHAVAGEGGGVEAGVAATAAYAANRGWTTVSPCSAWPAPSWPPCSSAP
ncbi:MAG: hypothetical protein ACRD2W_10645 [Acidimicrobiales bacterium]